jgi:hypothetical protein
MRIGKLLLLGTIIAVLAVLPANGFAKETLVYGTTEKVIDMDPANAYDFHTWEIFYNIYQGLLRYLRVRPTLFQVWQNLMTSVPTARNIPLSSEKA